MLCFVLFYYCFILYRPSPPPSSFAARARAPLAGEIMSRTSLRTIVMKKWKERSFWVWERPARLLLFRSQEDYSDWMQNPYHNEKERKYLVKLAVDFVQEVRAPTCRGFTVTQTKSKVSDLLRFFLIYLLLVNLKKNNNYAQPCLETQVYDRKTGAILHQFKLEKVWDYGPNIVAAFASESPKQLSDLKECVCKMINIGRQGGSTAGIIAGSSAPQQTHYQQSQYQQQQYQQQQRGPPSPAQFRSPPNSRSPAATGGVGPQPRSQPRQQHGRADSRGAYNFEQLTLD